MTLATGGAIAASIVPFDLTTGIAAVASVALALFVVAMIAFAVGPLLSSDGADRHDAAADAAGVDPGDD